MHISSNHQYLLFKWSPSNNIHRPSQLFYPKPQNRTSSHSHKPLQILHPIHSLQPTTPFSTHKHTQKANSMIPQNQSLLDCPSILPHTLNKLTHIPNPNNPPILRTTTRTHYPLTAPNLLIPIIPLTAMGDSEPLPCELILLQSGKRKEYISNYSNHIRTSPTCNVHFHIQH